jgi:alkylation response protein AidB-like acyl-CoA dehydrogenase
MSDPLKSHLEGHLPPTHPLSPRRALRGLAAAIRALVDYRPLSLWEQDTRSLPRPLAAYRRRALAFAARELAPRALRGDLDPHGPEVEAALRIGAREGYLTDALPRPFGSASVPLLAYPIQWVHCLKMEEFCAACAGLGLVLGAHGLGTLPLLLSGDLGVVRRFVLPAYRRTRAGEPYVMAFAITEPGAGSDVEESTGAMAHTPGTVAQQVPGGWCLNGRKVFISGGDIAEAVTLFAALKGEGMASWTCFLVRREMPGFSVVRTEHKMGQRASRAAELQLEDVFVPDDHVIGGLRQGWAINRATLNFSRIPVGAIALGIARGALEAATDFVCRERLARRRLIDYQEVQLALAGALADTSAMRALIWHSARSFTPTQAKSAMTKFFCGDTAMRVCETAMELMGNHGVLHGNRAEKHLRDARLTQIYEGTNEINRLAVIEDLQEQLLARMTADASEPL